MARRRIKKRTHTNVDTSQKRTERTPKSMVIRIGASAVGGSVSTLVKDVREVLQPETAARLRETRSNRLRDFVSMSGPLGVTHLLLFSRSASGNVNLRIAVTPRGPTLHFRVKNYALCKDIMRSQKHPKTAKDSHKTPPLLVMSNMQTVPADTTNPEQQATRRLESLVTDMFSSLFPQINPTLTPLQSVKRVLLLNREPAAAPSPTASPGSSLELTLRHYSIRTKRTGLAKPLKRLHQAATKPHATATHRGRGVPNLSGLQDVAQFLLDPTGSGSYTSASESEPDTDVEAEVEVEMPADKRIHYRDKLAKLRAAEDPGVTGTAGGMGSGGGAGHVEKRGVLLHELGPRMRLRLMKVEEGMCAGKVLWHDHIEKTDEERRKLDQMWAVKRQEKEERRRIQRENVEKKKLAKREAKANGQVDENDKEGEEEEEEEDYEDWEMEDYDDYDQMDED